jgi:RNA polymerase sigma factor (sigma-70 family)
VPAVADATIKAAIGGDRAALEAVVRGVRDDVYRLAHRMLWHPQDAEDATQEILIRVVTRLSTFRGDAQLRTWAHRIAVNYLLTTRQRRMERQALSFDAFGEDLARGLDTAYEAPGIDDELLAEEVKIGCTQGLLLCLDREQRVAYILSEIFELPGEEAAAILGITPAAYRKRAQRARDRIQAFMRGHCGLLDGANPCRCARRVGAAIALGRVDPQRLLFVREQVRTIERFHDAAAVYRSHPQQRAPERVVAAVIEAIADG